MNLTPFKWLCGAGLFAIFSSTLSKSPVLPLFSAHLGAGAAEVGLIAAASTLAGIAFSLPAGMLSDRLGRKTMLAAGGVVFASAPLLYFFVGGTGQLAAARFYHGLATAIFVPVAMAFVSDLHEGAKGEKLGWFSTATLVGRFAAPLAGGALLGFFGTGRDTAFQAIYGLCLAAGALALIATLRVPAPRPPAKAPAGCRELMTGLAELAASRPLIALGAVEAAILFVYGTVEVFLPLYALEQGIGAFEVGVCLSAQVVTLAATKPVMGRLSDRRGRSGQILWGSALGVLSAAGLSMSGHFILILLLSVLIGFSLSVVTASTSAAVADITRCEMRGSAMGIFGTLMDLGHSAGPMVSGMLAAWLGFGAAFIGAAIVLALAAAAFISTRAGQLDPCALGKPP